MCSDDEGMKSRRGRRLDLPLYFMFSALILHQSSDVREISLATSDISAAREHRGTPGIRYLGSIHRRHEKCIAKDVSTGMTTEVRNVFQEIGNNSTGLANLEQRDFCTSTLDLDCTRNIDFVRSGRGENHCRKWKIFLAIG